VQFLLNAMDANTARIAQAYAESVVATYNSGLRDSGLNVDFRRVTPAGAQPHSEVLLYPHTSTTGTGQLVVCGDRSVRNVVHFECFIVSARRW